MVFAMPSRSAQGPDEPPPAPDRRERLVRSGWAVLDDLPLVKVVAGATTAAVAAEAGVTTGSFFHHFPNAAAFADALVLSYVEVPSSTAEMMDGLADSAEQIDLIQLMRTALVDTWQVMVEDPEITARFRGQLLLSAHHHAELSSPQGAYRTVADVLRQGYRVREDEAVAAWEAIIALTGRVVVEPFSLARTATALTALFEGLQIRRAVDPDAVDDEMFGDIAASLATVITGPQGGRPRLAEDRIEIVSDAELSPQARSGVRRRRATRERIVSATAGMFGEGWEQVSASEIAERAGVSNQTVLNLFGSVRGVAALSFAHHAAEIRHVASEQSSGDPIAALRATLIELAERAAADAEAARALLSERLEVALHRGGSLRDLDIRLEVPLAAAVMVPLAEMDLGGVDPLELATTLINFVLATCVSRTGSPREVVELALRLVPLTAFVPPRSAP
jgi:AcrR family transcriptional regulator